MSTISEHIEIIEQVSTDALEHLLGEQWSVERFVFCGVEKINKIIKAIKALYPEMQENRDLEFSCGILLRSLLMDCILTLPIKDLSFKKGDKTFQVLKGDVAYYCLKVIGDGTYHLINDA